MTDESIATDYGNFGVGFRVDSLDNLCGKGGIQTGPFGSQLHKKDYVPIGTPIITVEHLGDNRIIHRNLPRVSDYDKNRLSKYILREGDIVFSRVGSVDRRSIVREEEDGWLFSGRCLRVRPDKSRISPGYLSYFFGLPAFQEHIRAIAVGATMPSLNTRILSGVSIAYPSLPEQRAIAHILGTLDDKIELNRRMNQTLEEMARALFKSWFVDFDPVLAKVALKQHAIGKPANSHAAPKGNGAAPAAEWTVERARAYLDAMDPQIANLFPDRLVDSELGETPEGWVPAKLADVIQIHDSKRIPLNSRQRADRQGPFPYYGAAGIMDYVDDFLFDGIHVLTGEDGSVVDPHGHPVVQYVWGQFWVNNHAHVLRGTNGVSEEHLYLLLKQANVIPFVTGAVQPKLSQRNLRSIPIIYPGLPVCLAFGEIVATLFELLRMRANELSTLSMQRDTMMPTLLSGSIPATV